MVLLSLLFARSVVAEEPADVGATPEEVEEVRQDSAQVQMAAGLHDKVAALARMVADQKVLAEAVAKGCLPPRDWIAPTAEAYAADPTAVPLPACLATCDCPKAPAPATPEPSTDTTTTK
jgi:hypothetical protein